MKDSLPMRRLPKYESERLNTTTSDKGERVSQDNLIVDKIVRKCFKAQGKRYPNPKDAV